jgi:hypothetical protein
MRTPLTSSLSSNLFLAILCFFFCLSPDLGYSYLESRQMLHRKSIAILSVAASLATWNVTCPLLRVSESSCAYYED